jgi:hypothetical protein
MQTHERKFSDYYPINGGLIKRKIKAIMGIKISDRKLEIC